MTPGAVSAPEPRRPLTPAQRRQQAYSIQQNGSGLIEVRFSRDAIEVFNLLAPFSTITQVDRNYSPVAREVWLRKDLDTYPEAAAGGGKHAITAKGLQKLADASGIQFDDPKVDWMGGLGVTVYAKGRRRAADGTWIVNTSPKTVFLADLVEQAREEMIEKARKYDKPVPTEQAIAKRIRDEKQHMVAKADTKAKNRVIRALLQIPSALEPDAFNLPFLLVQWAMTPDYENPHVSQILAQNMGNAASGLYGGRPNLEVIEGGDQEEREVEPPDEDLEDTLPEFTGQRDDDGGFLPPEDPAVSFGDVPAIPKQPKAPTRLDGQLISELVQTEEGRAQIAARAVADGVEDKIAPWLAWATGRHVQPDQVVTFAESGWSA